jgi:hypothetical protein
VARFPTDATAVSLRASPRIPRTLSRASTRFARGARRTWSPTPKQAPDASTKGAGLLARLFGRRG